MIGRWPFGPLVVLLVMTWKNGGFSLRRLPFWMGYVLRYTLLEPVRLVERWCYDQAIRKHQLSAPPLFILGHWRSGTSYLQTLLSLDPEFTTSTIYRSLFSDVFLLTERWLKPLLGGVGRVFGVQYAIQRSALDFDVPAEGDLGICCLCSPFSYTWGHVFPARFSQWMQRVVYRPTDEVIAGWFEAYHYLICKLSYGAGGRRVVMKSPGDTARLNWLSELFPEAKFIYIHRDPVEVFHSNRYLWEVIQRDHGVQDLTEEQVDAQILEHYVEVMARYQAQREALPSERLAEIAYAELKADPVGTLSSVYEQLDLGPVPVEAIAQFQRTQPVYGAQTYTTSPELAERLRSALAPIPSTHR